LNNSIINQTAGNIWITSGNLNIVSGALQIAGTNVIDSSRNLVGINLVNQNLNMNSNSIINAAWLNASNLNLTSNAYIGGNVGIGTLSSGSVLFAGSGGLVSQDNANLFWDNTNKRLGIGTTTPGEKLEVSGNIKLSGYINVGGSYIRKVGSSIVISDV
jgi:hypothetical protein